MNPTVKTYEEAFAARNQAFTPTWMSAGRRAVARQTNTIKRAIDVMLSASLLLLISPLLLAVAVAIRLESRGPVFFHQTRVGLNGRHFRFWKFRSMHVDAEQRKQELLDQNHIAGNLLFKMKEDPRVTRVGKFIRKYSIDELPQLWNVLAGEMSLVGPRPAVPGEVAKYTPYQRQRLGVLPGITCSWQVGGRSEIPFEQQVDLDIEYMRNRNVGTDIKLLFLTIPAVLLAKGAY